MDRYKKMHYAPTPRRLAIKDPMCGYVAPDDEICSDPALCTCPECLDWIRPDHPLVKARDAACLRNITEQRDAALFRIRELEACVLAYWHAKDWGDVGAADSLAAKLLPADMKTRASRATLTR